MFSGTDPYRPSFFEMVAQDRLVSGLKPALHHIMVSLSRQHRFFQSCLTYHEEIFASLVYLLERHYLKLYDASFAESFYGLKRIQYIHGIPLDTPQNRPRVSLTAQQKSRTLFILVVIPYIQKKLEYLYKKGTDGVIGEDGFQQFTSSSDLPPIISHLYSTFLRIYPYLSSLYELILFIYQLRYLFEYTPFYSPWYYILGQTVRRLTMEDMIAHMTPHTSHPMDNIWSSSQLSFFQRIRAMLSRSLNYLANYVKWGIILGIFVFKFMEWWHSPQNRLSQATQLPIPPPPQPAKPSSSGLAIPSDPTICPLCLQTRTNPACPPSGYVYCYPCIFHYITDHGICPITRMSCGVEQIRKIYQT